MGNTEKQKKESASDVNTSLHELLLKQQALILQQSDYISKANDRKKEEEDDEIDLSVLIPGFLKRKKRGGDDQSEDGTDIGFIAQQFDFVLRNKLILLAFFGIGIFYSVFEHYVNPRLYQSTMTVASGFFDNTYYASLLYPLGTLSESNSYKGLSQTLDLDTSITKNIISIQYRDFLSKDEAENENDSTLEVINRPYFKIAVAVSDNVVLPDLQSGIFNYLNNNVYVNQQIKIKKETLSRSVEELKKQNLWLDTLKVAIVGSLNSAKASDGPVSYTMTDSKNPNEVLLNREDNVKVDAASIISNSQNLSHRIVQTEEKLRRLKDNLQTVDGFAANAVSASLHWPSVGRNAAYTLLLGLVLIYSIALFRNLVNFRR